MADIHKHLERGRRLAEKGKLRDAVGEYQAALEQSPGHAEAVQALADLHTQLGETGRAALYYGLQFDRLVEAGDAAKAGALYTRFLRSAGQPPERLLRYALLQQKLNRAAEAIEVYALAAEGFKEQSQGTDALLCLEKIAQLDPENPARHLNLAHLAELLGKKETAAHGYLRAGQISLAVGELDGALELFAAAHQLAPHERSVSLLYAHARLRKGDAAGAVALLEPFSPGEADATFLGVYGEALLRKGDLDRARAALEAYYRQKPDSFSKLFELAGAYVATGQDGKAVETLAVVQEWMFGLRRESDFVTQVEKLESAAPQSMELAQFAARMYESLNREAKYFDALVRLFDLYLKAERIPEACEALDRLVDIDPYDYRNHERIAQLEGKAGADYIRSVMSRAAKAATVLGRTESGLAAGDTAGNEMMSEEERARQVLEDLIVQVEIFLQYSLKAKAVERLERIAEMFPGEEEKNERLRAAYERASWWPKGAPLAEKSAGAKAEAAPVGGLNADTRPDLAAIAEITKLMYRQATPREVVAVAVREIATYLGAAHCLAAVGRPGEAGQISSEYRAKGAAAASKEAGAGLLRQLSVAVPDSLGGVELRATVVPALRELGLQTALGVQLTDNESQEAAGVLVVGETELRTWKPSESFFLQSIGDQLVLCVSHTRLRTLVRTLSVADERTGLLGRGAYLDCLLAEIKRAKSQRSTVSLAILQIDRGQELLRQHGEAQIDQYIQQVAKALESSVRQGDLAVKYTAWAIAFILPDTGLEAARAVAEKLRRAAAEVEPPWKKPAPTISAVVAPVADRPEDEHEDRVTEWINRAEEGLEDARSQGGDALLALAAPEA